MTAEIAILNKSAVALAADSAVTISAGSEEQKIFDSADKLFELTQGNAIGIMINADMNFMETPLAVLIKCYRDEAPLFDRVEDAAKHFLQYLADFAKSSPNRLKLEAIQLAIQPLFKAINDRARDKFNSKAFKGGTVELEEEYANDPDKLSILAEESINFEIEAFEHLVDHLRDADFVGGGSIRLTKAERETIKTAAANELLIATDVQREAAIKLAEKALRKIGTDRSNGTGVIVAGFGAKELFPTLVSFQIFGTIGGRLKYWRTNTVDIDRDGEIARVLPFAQREMVERFLYGLDSEIRRKVTDFCKKSVPSIAEQLLDGLDLSDDDAKRMQSRALKLEQAFYTGLDDKGFDAIQQQSRSEIEDMVEFMPKPELARMAEALVNLTSIKRRVSRGFETVGGPIDVAVISKAEGFVWVKRKHYFPEELNARYFQRIGARPKQNNGDSDDQA